LIKQIYFTNGSYPGDGYPGGDTVTDVYPTDTVDVAGHCPNIS